MKFFLFGYRGWLVIYCLFSCLEKCKVTFKNTGFHIVMLKSCKNHVEPPKNVHLHILTLIINQDTASFSSHTYLSLNSRHHIWQLSTIPILIILSDIISHHVRSAQDQDSKMAARNTNINKDETGLE